MKKITFFASVLLVSSLLFTSCSHDDLVDEVVPQQVETSSVNARATTQWIQHPTWTCGAYAATKKTFTVKSGKRVVVSLSHAGGSSNVISMLAYQNNLALLSPFPMSVGVNGYQNVNFVSASNSLELRLTKPLSATAIVTVSYEN